MIQVSGVCKTYERDGRQHHVLDHVTFDLASRQTVAIVGQSGAGKSTLLNLLAVLDRADAGTICINGLMVHDMSVAQAIEWRKQQMGLIFQFHHLLGDFSILENVMMPLLIRGEPRQQAREQAMQLIERLGLAGCATAFPQTLSGGEQQRVAIARAVIHRPQIILADEPTGNLDSEHAHAVFDLLLELNQELGATLVVVTHSHELAGRLNHCLVLGQGKLVSFV